MAARVTFKKLGKMLGAIRPIWLAVAAAPFAVLWTPAQNPPVPPAPAAAPAADSGGKVPTFTTGSHLVIVDVTVKDKSGHTINGLQASDFAVSEDNIRQKIEVFEPQNLTMNPEPPPALKLDDQLKLPEAANTVITYEAPGKVQYHDKRLMVLFFDFSSMQVTDQLRAQAAALEFLKSKITKDDLVAVMMYTSTLNVLSDFTADRDVLTDVINGLPIGEATELAGLADTGACTEEDTGAAFVADETEFNILNTDQKLAALEDAAKLLKNLPEKKVLVYLSGGVNKTGIDNQAQLEASINAMYKSNVTLYSVDVRGLMADPPGGAAGKAGSRGAGAFNGANYNAQRAQINDSQETLSTLATETGGKAYFDSNDLAAGIQMAQQSVSSYYILGYYATNLKEDGRYRRISVKLTNGNTSARLEHRQGYYADKDWHRMNTDDKELQLKEAIAAGDPITDIPLGVQIDWFRVGPTTYFVPVSVRVPGSVIELATKGTGGLTQLDYLGQIQDETRAVVGNVRDYIKISLDQENKEMASKRIFQYDAGFTLSPGRYHMKFLVRENVTGKIGTFETRFVVPDLAADTSELKLSTLVLSNQREPLSSAVGAAERISRKNQAANPLIDGDQKIMPNITHVFRRRQNLFVTFDVYDAHPDPKDRKLRRVKVSLSFFNEAGAKAFEVAPVEVTQTSLTRPDALPVKLQIPLKDIAPGAYTCQVNVVDVVGRKFAFPRAQLVIAP